MAIVSELVFLPSILIGILISIVELAFVHSDEGAGVHWLGHGLHAVPVCVIGTIISMHADLVLRFIPGLSKIPALNIVIPILVGLIIAFKVKAAAAIIHGHGNVGEKLPHALIIGALVAAAPFVWPFIEPIVPKFLKAF